MQDLGLVGTDELTATTRTLLGVALVGSGTIGSVIASAVSEVDDAELRLVVGRTPGSARALAAEHGAGWSDDPDGYLATTAADDIDVVVIATPSGSHADLAVAALEAGKDVLVEKPLDITLEAVDRIIDAERRTGRVVGVISQHRFDSASETVIEAARSGRLGRLTSAIASCAWWREQAYYDSSAWRGTWSGDGGGATINQAIHLVDLLLAVMGEPVEVHARVGRLAHDRIEVEDTAVATVQFASGALGIVHATTAAFPGVEARLSVFGDHGSAVIVDDELASFQVAPGSSAASSAVVEAAGVGEAPRRLGPAHTRQLRDFVDVVRARRAGDPLASPRVGTADGRRALALVLGMYESARTGRSVRL